MKGRLASTLLLAGLCACSSLISTPRTHAELRPEELGIAYSPEELREDLRFLVQVVEEVHPRPYARRSRAEIAALAAELEASIDRPLTRLEFWPRAARLAAAFGDAHTTVGGLGEEWSAFLGSGEKLLPVALEERDGGWLIRRNLQQDLAPLEGCTLRRVDGIDLAALAAEHATLRAGEPAFVASVFTQNFFWHLWRAGARAPYDVEAEGAAGPIRVEVPGLSAGEIGARQQGQPAPGSWSLAWLEGDVALIDFRSMQGKEQWESFLRSTFAEITRRDARGVIVDLRRNGGGDSGLGDMLLAHLTERPYRFCARKEWRSSARYRRYLKDHLVWWLRWLPLQYLHPFGREFWGAEEGELVVQEAAVEPPEPAEPRFAGPWCLLIGPGTFSSAVMLANAAGDFELAPLFGSPTGGVPNESGEVYSCDLPHTRLVLGVSSAVFVRANGDGDDPRPVLPTHPVQQSAADGAAGRDAVLEAARAWVLAQPRP